METFHKIVSEFKDRPDAKFIKSACVSIKLDTHLKIKAINKLKEQYK